MKRKILPIAILGVLAIALVSGTLFSSSSPGKKSGSPLDGSTCVSCHSGSSVAKKDNWVTSNIPETGYKPNTTYTILISAEDATAAKIGFELTAENATSKVGTFKITNTSTTTLTNGNKAVTHKDAGNIPSQGIVVWNVDWTSPATPAGDVTFYAAFNAANGNRSTSGDRIFTSTYTAKQDQTSTSVDKKSSVGNVVYPNPSYGFVVVQSENELETISVFDMQGRQIKTEKTGGNKTKIDLSGLKNGNYLIKALTSKGEFVKKVQLNN